jgi:hypothetical protein
MAAVIASLCMAATLLLALSNANSEAQLATPITFKNSRLSILSTQTGAGVIPVKLKKNASKNPTNKMTSIHQFLLCVRRLNPLVDNILHLRRTQSLLLICEKYSKRLYQEYSGLIWIMLRLPGRVYAQGFTQAIHCLDLLASSNKAML